MALEAASSEALDNGKMFVPQNWIKSKTSLKDLRMSIKQYLASLRISSKQFLNQLNTALEMSKEDFSSRWTAD